MRSPTRPIVDHAVINVLENLDAASRAYEKLGFALTPRGHQSLGSSNHLCIFGENYLELLGFEPGNRDKRPDLWAQPLGLTGLVFKTDEPDALYDDIVAHGLRADAPATFTRPVAVAGHMHEARFRTVRLARDTLPESRVYFCHHFTPELVWNDAWRAHPNGVTDIVGFVFVSNDPEAAARVFDTIFGPASVKNDGAGLALDASQARIHILSADEAHRQYGVEAVPSAPEQRPVALVFQTSSLAQLRATLDANGVACREAGDGSVLVAPDQAAGVALRFVQAKP